MEIQSRKFLQNSNIKNIILTCARVFWNRMIFRVCWCHDDLLKKDRCSTENEDWTGILDRRVFKCWDLWPQPWHDKYEAMTGARIRIHHRSSSDRWSVIQHFFYGFELVCTQVKSSFLYYSTIDSFLPLGFLLLSFSSDWSGVPGVVVAISGKSGDYSITRRMFFLIFYSNS